MKMFRCTQCTRSFSRRENLNRHSKSREFHLPNTGNISTPLIAHPGDRVLPHRVDFVQSNLQEVTWFGNMSCFTKSTRMTPTRHLRYGDRRNWRHRRATLALHLLQQWPWEKRSLPLLFPQTSRVSLH